MRVGKNISFTVIFSATVVLALTLSGCSSPRYIGPEYLKTPRQIPPQPVYNRVTPARPPSVLPARSLVFEGAPETSPILHLEVKGRTVEVAIKQLASLALYRSYVAATVADRIISIDEFGTVDELADKISTEAGVYVSVDHGNHELRVLPAKRTRAKLYR